MRVKEFGNNKYYNVQDLFMNGQAGKTFQQHVETVLSEGQEVLKGITKAGWRLPQTTVNEIVGDAQTVFRLVESLKTNLSDPTVSSRYWIQESSTKTLVNGINTEIQYLNILDDSKITDGLYMGGLSFSAEKGIDGGRIARIKVSLDTNDMKSDQFNTGFVHMNNTRRMSYFTPSLPKGKEQAQDNDETIAHLGSFLNVLRNTIPGSLKRASL